MPILKRDCFHQEGDEINLMELQLTEGDCGGRHYNVGRDEVLVVLDGEVEITLEGGKPIKLDDGTRWLKIEAGAIHQMRCLTSSAKVLEIIVGEHFDGACINID